VAVESLRKQARVLMWLVTAPFVVMALLAVAVVGSVMSMGGKGADVLLYWYTPMFLYLWAIWMIRHALQDISRGEMFGAVVPRLLFRVGLALFVGALYEVLGRRVVAELYWGEYHSSQMFEASGITLGVVGASMVLIAGLLRRAMEMRNELDGFF
jgi:hypothetical protein